MAQNRGKRPPQSTPSSFPGGRPQGAHHPTTARVLWDDEYLYVAFVATDAHISADLTNRDAPVSREYAVEVFCL